MNPTGSLSKRVAREYARRRNEAERLGEIRVRQVHGAHPRLLELERRIAEAGAESLPVPAAVGDAGMEAARRMAELLRERADYLQTAGLDPEYDRPAYACRTCSDTGYRVEASREGARPVRCRCQDALRAALLMEEANLPLPGAGWTAFDASLLSGRTDPARFGSDRSPRHQAQAILEACRQFVDRFDEPDTRNLLFTGNPGTGKTFMASLVGNAMIAKNKSVLYLTVPALMEALRQYQILSTAYDPDQERYERATDLRSAIQDCDFLILDDLGTEPPSDFRLPALLQLLDQRAGFGEEGVRRTLLATNLELPALRDTYDERLLSRILGGFSVFRFFGEDLRSARKKAAVRTR